MSGAVATPPTSGLISTVISDDHSIDPSLTLDEMHQMIGTHLAIAEASAKRHDHREVEDQAQIILGALDAYKRRLRGRLTAAKWKSWGDLAPKDPKTPQP